MIEGSMISNLDLVGIDDTDAKTGSDENDVTRKEVSDKDGCFGWLIVVCAFLCFSLMAVNSVSFGVFITELEVTFDASRSMIGVIGACKLGLSTVAGLVSGPLVKKFGCRPICCAGILLAATGHLAAAFSDNVWGILITFGILAGAGAGLAFIPTVVIVQQHFLKKRALAAGIASTGVSAFAIAFSPLTRYLINMLGWRGALIMLSAVNVQMFVPAALFRPPRSEQLKVIRARIAAKEEKERKQLIYSGTLPDIVINGVNGRKSGETHRPEVISHNKVIVSRETHSLPASPSLTAKIPQNLLAKEKLLLPPQRSPQVTRSNLSLVVPKDKLLLPREEEEEVKPRACSAFCACFDRSILSCSFVLFLATSVTIMYSMDAYYLRSTPRAINMGVDPVAASYLPSVIGIAGIIGRTLSGVFARAISPFSVNGIACLLAGITICGSVLSPSLFGAHAAFCACFGMTFGISQGIQPTVVVSLLGVEKLPLGMSWTLLLGGAGRVTANLVSGWLFDLTGGYSAPLLVSGTLLVLGGCSALLMAFLRHRHHKAKQDKILETREVEVKA